MQFWRIFKRKKKTPSINSHIIGERNLWDFLCLALTSMFYVLLLSYAAWDSNPSHPTLFSTALFDLTKHDIMEHKQLSKFVSGSSSQSCFEWGNRWSCQKLESWKQKSAEKSPACGPNVRTILINEHNFHSLTMECHATLPILKINVTRRSPS